MANEQQSVNTLTLMGLNSIKQDTTAHQDNQVETNKLIHHLHLQLKNTEVKVDKLEQSVQQLNVALTNLISSQTQTNNKLDKLADNIATLSTNTEKLWRERWLYRILPLTLLGFIGLGCWQIISNWENIAQFFNAMNSFFQTGTQ